MLRPLIDNFARVVLLLVAGAPLAAYGQYGAEVVSFDAGAAPAPGFPDPAASLGEPERFTGEHTMYPGVVAAFSPPFGEDEIVSVGAGGHITIRLSHYAVPQAGPEIGVFENAGLALDFGAWPGIQAQSPVATFGEDTATVAVSENGVHWVSLGDVLFDRPSNGYTDLGDPFSGTPGSVPSDFQQPFTADLSTFAGLPYSDPMGPDVLEVLGGSGGGTWLDISGTGLTRVGYVRFLVAAESFELDAVSIAHGAVGGALPEPGSVALLTSLVVAGVAMRRRWRRAIV